MPRIESVCMKCGQTFIGRDATSKFCSQPCSVAARVGVSRGKGTARSGRPRITPRETVPCPRCQTPFERYIGDGKPQSIYCSAVCYHAARVGVARPDLLIAPETKHCERCGEAFLVGGEGRKARHHRYCSKTCAKSAYWESDRAKNWPLLPDAHGQAKQLSDNDVAWMAGLFDGEGCIAWPRRNLLHSVRIDVINTNRAVIDRVCEVTGTGRVQEMPKKKAHHSQGFIWHAYGDNARYLLHQMYPLLIIKKQAAAVALGFIKATEPPPSSRSESMLRGGMLPNGWAAPPPAPSEPITYSFNFNIMTFEGTIPCYGLMDPSPTIKILIDYPLTKPCTFEAKCPNPDGWTEVEFIEAVRMAYLEVYSLEEDPGLIPGLLNRAKSDGPVGIWGHGMAELFLEGAVKQEDGTWKLIVGS